ncbi:hypothetical protein PG989_000349 [Apiospora arundinis]
MNFSSLLSHEKLRGIVTEETVKCQLLYELQGNIYLNSDVKADITHVAVRQAGKNRVHVSGAKGHPPPPTTKLAVFYRGGYQGEHTDKPWDMQRRRSTTCWRRRCASS